MSSTSSDNNDGCPFINDKGEVIALLQLNKTNNNVCATDAQFINDIKATGLSANDPALRQTEIRVALPDEFKQAQLALMISSQRYDSLTYVSIIHEFINKFSKYIDGYSSLAQLYLNGNDFENAALTMDEAIKTVTKKDEAHSSYSNLIYQKELYKSNIPFAKWNLQLALDEAKAAYAVNPIPAYKHQENKILFTQGEYEKAYEGFMTLTKTDIKGAELYYEAAQCKKMLKAPDTEILTLLDSAVSTCKVPYNQMSAPYILARATQYDAMGESRKAISDYNTYEELMQGQLNSNFYYIREQAEVKGHLFQQALNDIDSAIKLSPNEPTYYAEKASVQLRVNMLDDAISTSQSCINAYPEYADAYTILGLAQILKGDKKEGKANLEKAVQLGNKQAETLLEKYK
jgi:predicted Zn-dependent protease